MARSSPCDAHLDIVLWTQWYTVHTQCHYGVFLIGVRSLGQRDHEAHLPKCRESQATLCIASAKSPKPSQLSYQKLCCNLTEPVASCFHLGLIDPSEAQQQAQGNNISQAPMWGLGGWGAGGPFASKPSSSGVSSSRQYEIRVSVAAFCFRCYSTYPSYHDFQRLRPRS